MAPDKGHHTGRDPAHQNPSEGQADPTSATILVGNQINKTQAKGRRTRQLHLTLVSFNTKRISPHPTLVLRGRQSQGLLEPA